MLFTSNFNFKTSGDSHLKLKGADCKCRQEGAMRLKSRNHVANGNF